MQRAKQCDFVHSKEPSFLGESRKITWIDDSRKIWGKKLFNESFILEAAEAWWKSGSSNNYISDFEDFTHHKFLEESDFFAQLASMEKTYIGCGTANCPAHDAEFNTMQTVVCQYYPRIQRNSSKSVELWGALRTYEQQIRDVIQDHS
ncbi:unnamed protein product [Dracunculus medinensis]|uniref:SCP domain-containing protein n=1 Tax=Dracunculus medinensis TaxID=318479 RepID=A0A0N4URE1_DRAME|nr:unnamed protein product [Dracunculus medinensis]